MYRKQSYLAKEGSKHHQYNLKTFIEFYISFGAMITKFVIKHFK